MSYKLKDHHLSHIFSIISKDYDVYGVDEDDNILKLINTPSKIKWIDGRGVMSPKKILFPDGQELKPEHRKIAFVGIPLCDISAIHLLISKLKKSGLINQRSDLLLIGAECKPDDDCFCEFFGTDKLRGFDIYLQKEGSEFSAFSGTTAGEKILKKLALKKIDSLTLRPVSHKSLNKISKEEITKLIGDKEKFQDLWDKIANNCFGCGACSSVCPLCYCFRQDEKNLIDGGCETCISWDSCFSKEFSEIQKNSDLRPNNSSRLYNWYHHKFVCSPYLCTGCGRCIKACPANLNIKNILLAIEKLDDDKHE